MKTSILYLIMGLLVINSLNAQVKIGDNPQNLDPASLLELQSNNRVLVITRVTDAQMGSINPLQGALVYNTDQECLHYYNGSEWINICEELDNSFTVSTRADSLSQFNPNARDNTIAILQSVNPDGSNNYNFEVNQITGANIVNTSINGSTKLQPKSVTNDRIADKAVALENLEDANNAGDLFMYTGSTWNYVNRSDLLNTQLDSIVGNEYNTGSGINAGIFTITDGGGDIQTNLISGDTDNDISAGTDGALFLNETDDQTAAEVSYDNTTSGLTATEAQAAIDELAASNAADGDTDDTNEYNTGSGIAAGVLSITDDGGTESIDLISVDTDNDISAGTDGALFLNETDDQTAAEVSYDNTTSGLTATEAQAAIDELAASNAADGDTDDTNEYNTGSGIAAGVLSITDDGGTESIDLISVDTDNDISAGTDGALFLNETDDQTAAEVSYDNTTSGLTATEAQAAIDELAASNAADGDTDDTNEYNTGSGIAAGVLSITDDGGTESIDLISVDTDNDISAGTDGALFLNETDDQTAAEVSYDNTTSGLTATEAQAAIDELAASNAADGDTDDTNEYNTGSGIAAGVLSITDDGGTESIDLISVDTDNDISAGTDGALFLNETDDQTAAEVSYDNTTSGLTATEAQAAIDELAASNAADGDTDDTNEYNTGSGIAAGVLSITDDGGTESIDLISVDTDNDISAGTDGALFLNETDDQTAAEVSYDNTTSGLTATEAQAAIDELAANRVSSDIGNVISSGTDGGAFLNTTVKPITVVGNDITLTEAHYTIILDSTGNLASGFSIPAPGGVPTGKIYIIRNESGSTVTISDGTNNLIDLANDSAFWVQTNGSNWFQIN
ncbi:beta strand repeat-containing protein [Flagellimonas oceanensis]|uniref:beta strand repeat-containing protein n=1 Tax=Flagellimonas oceanensis TaxID=2499163 RepID=UPI003BAD177B